MQTLGTLHITMETDFLKYLHNLNGRADVMPIKSNTLIKCTDCDRNHDM